MTEPTDTQTQEATADQAQESDQKPAAKRGRPKKGTKLQNVHRGPVAIHGTLWKPGDTHEVTAEVAAEKRIQNAVKNGILKEV